MRGPLLIFTLAILSFANMAQAREPLILFYNYAPPAPAFALVNLVPQDHQEFDVSPAVVELTFSESILPDKSSINVYDEFNNPVAVSLSSPKDTRLSASLPPHLLSETYRIEWNATCACVGNAVINGITYFTVN